MNNFNKLTTGQILKTRRLEKGLTIEEVSQETKITQRFIKALESDDYDAFDSFIFASGFIKIYGKYLGLQVDKLIALYRRESWTKKNNKTNPKGFKIKKKFAIREYLTHDNIVKLILIIFLLAIGFYIIADFHKYNEKPEINILSPNNNLTTNNPSVVIKGLTSINSELYVNNNEIPINPDFSFEYTATLKPGINEITITAINKINKKKKVDKKLIVNYQTTNINSPTTSKQDNLDKETTQGKLKIITIAPNVWIQLIIDDRQEIAQILTDRYSKEFTVKKYFQIITGRPKSTKVYFNNKEIQLKINVETGTVDMTCKLDNNNINCN